MTSSYDDDVLDHVLAIMSSDTDMDRIRAIIGETLASDIELDTEIERVLGDGNETRAEALRLVTRALIRQGAAAHEQAMAQEERRLTIALMTLLQQKARRRHESLDDLPIEVIKEGLSEVAQHLGVSVEVATEMFERCTQKKTDGEAND